MKITLGKFHNLSHASKMTGNLLVGLCVICLLSFTAATSAFAYEYPKMTLKFGHPYNEVHPLAKGAQLFADTVEERSDGRITIKVFPNSTIGSSRDLVESMQMNVVDLALVPTTNVATFYSQLDVFYLPFLFRDREHAYAFADGDLGQKLYEDMRKKIGIRTLAIYESGFRTITTRDKRIKTPEDMEGVKFRVVNNPLNVATFAALGANPTPMAISEVFTALQQGTVDGQDNPVGNVKAFGFDKVQNFITLSNHQWAGIMFLTNDNKWTGYPKEVQELLQKVALESQEWERNELNRVEEQYLSEMAADGMTVTRLTPEQASAFKERMASVWDEYGKRLGADFIQSIVDIK